MIKTEFLSRSMITWDAVMQIMPQHNFSNSFDCLILTRTLTRTFTWSLTLRLWPWLMAMHRRRKVKSVLHQNGELNRCWPGMEAGSEMIRDNHCIELCSVIIEPWRMSVNWIDCVDPLWLTDLSLISTPIALFKYILNIVE